MKFILKEYLPIPSGKDLETLKIIKEDYLEYNKDSQLDMRHFNAMDGKKHIEQCGTVGCALGNCVRIPRLSPIEEDFMDVRGKYFNYFVYQSRIIPHMYACRGEDRAMWDFLFSSRWTSYNNTVEGFLERLDLVLEGKVPSKWEYSGYKPSSTIGTPFK